MIALASDHGGFALKEEIKKHLDGKGVAYEDFGCFAPESCDYPDVAKPACQAVVSGRCEKALLFCGTGMGVSQTANKFKGVYAAVVESVFAARQCRLINNCNVMCAGGYILGEYMAREMVDAFINTEHTQGFEPERAAYLKRQFARLQEIEGENMK